jgi:hypothetical protein
MSSTENSTPTAPDWFTPKTRAWLYGIIAAVAPLLVLLGALSDDVAQYVLNIAAAVPLVGGNTMAIRHVKS